jgi:hypothetical protein
VTSGRREIARMASVLYGPGSTWRFDGLLAARIRGKADWVRLAAAMLAMATPPMSPIRSTSVR